MDVLIPNLGVAGGQGQRRNEGHVGVVLNGRASLEERSTSCLIVYEPQQLPVSQVRFEQKDCQRPCQELTLVDVRLPGEPGLDDGGGYIVGGAQRSAIINEEQQADADAVVEGRRISVEY